MEESIIYQSVIELYNNKSFEYLSHRSKIDFFINEKPGGFFGPKKNIFYNLSLKELANRINNTLLETSSQKIDTEDGYYDLKFNVILFIIPSGLIVTKYGFILVKATYPYLITEEFPFEKSFYKNRYLCEFKTLCFPKSVEEEKKFQKFIEGAGQISDFITGTRRYYTTLSGKQNTSWRNGVVNTAPILRIVRQNHLLIKYVNSPVKEEDFALLRIDDDKIDSRVIYNSEPLESIVLDENELRFFIELEKLVKKKRKTLIESEKSNEKLRVSSLNKSVERVVNELDKDGNGEVDVIEGNDFNLLLKKHQKSILEINREYIQQFVKVSTYLKTKKENIQSIFDSIKDIPDEELLNEYIEILKGNIHSYNLLLYHSLNMISLLVEDDMISFYEIYEVFDNLNMFDSKWERDVSQELSNIGDGLKSLMIEVRVMGEKISAGLSELTYATEQTNDILDNRLTEIDSSIQTNNLLTLINTFQTYKINKNTKSLR